ncbi:MAG: succinate dehydrogenase, cytochrome b556 subunit [Burkholderiales bacterium]
MHKRPVFLNLFEIQLPLPALVSIAHRVSGIVLFLALPLVLAAWESSLADAAGFTSVVGLLTGTPWRWLGFCLIWVFIQHFFSGLRHLMMDMGIGIDRVRARRSSIWVFALGLGATTLIVMRLW